MNNLPLVSVIITTFNGDHKLVRAINSVIMQTYNNVEVIVVDDNGNNTPSRKKTELMMSQFSSDNRVKYLKHSENMNGAVARNTGIQSARGKYIAFLDDDDIYDKQRIEKCVNKAESVEGNNAVITGVLTISNMLCINKYIPSQTGLDFHTEILKSHGALGSGSNIFVPLEAIKCIGGFDERFRRFQDVEFMVRITNFVNVLKIDEQLIIKDNSNIRFLPNYSGLERAVNLFLETFHEEIEKSVDRNDIYYSKYHDLLLYAYKCNDTEEIKRAWNYMNKLGNLGAFDKLRIVLKGQKLKLSHSKVYQIMRERSMKEKDENIRKTLTDNEIHFLASYISKE